MGIVQKPVFSGEKKVTKKKNLEQTETDSKTAHNWFQVNERVHDI